MFINVSCDFIQFFLFRYLFIMAKTADDSTDKLFFVLSVTQCFYIPYVQQHHTIGAWLEEHCALCPTTEKCGKYMKATDITSLFSLSVLRKAVNKSY